MTATRKQLVIAAAAGSILALAAPPFDLYPGLWLGMVGLAWCLEEAPELPLFAAPSRVGLVGARRGLVFGAMANVVALRFIPGVIVRFTPLPWAVALLALVLLALFEGTRWMVAAVACETLGRARVPRPLAFAAGVYAGTFVPTMIPWTVAGGVSPWPAMVQLADVCGERGVAFLMALAAGLAASGLRLARARDATTRRRGWAYVAGAVAVVTAQGLYGAARMKGVASWRAQAPTARVALVQASIGATTRWDDDRAPDIVQALRTLTTRAEAEGADLVVWPEGAYPYRIVHGARREGPGERPILGPGQHGPILTGLLTTGPAGAYNSAVVATRSGLSEGYDKRRLLWFGETVPLADRLPWMRRVFARGLGLVPGDKPVILPAGPVRASVLVCYEDTLPEAGRDGMAGAPNLLVNITNDAWFGGGESELHLRMAVLRSVELRRDMVRAVNLGVPSWVDATGRIRARGSPEFPDVLETQPALLDAPVTLYARFGDFPWALAALLLANVAVWKSVKRRG